MRVATWNLEQADPRRGAGAVQTRQIAEVGADLWLFTEARPDSVPSGFAVATSTPTLVPEPTYFAVIAAAGAVHAIDRPDVPTAADGLVACDRSDWLVVACCMPWRLGAPPLPPEAAPLATTGPAQWRVILGRLDGALSRLRRQYPGMPVLLGGDLNQGLSGWLTGGARGRAQLLSFVAKHDLTVYTADSPSAHGGAGAIDHICGTEAAVAGGWFMPATVPGREKLASDHAGYWAEFEATPTDDLRYRVVEQAVCSDG